VLLDKGSGYVNHNKNKAGFALSDGSKAETDDDLLLL
jgi:hypothetical protein